MGWGKRCNLRVRPWRERLEESALHETRNILIPRGKDWENQDDITKLEGKSIGESVGQFVGESLYCNRSWSLCWNEGAKKTSENVNADVTFKVFGFAKLNLDPRLP